MGDLIRYVAVGFGLGALVIFFPGGPQGLFQTAYGLVATDADRSIPAASPSPESASVAAQAILRPPSRQAQAPAGSASRTRIKADGRGHFVSTIEINGRPTKALVDTGATLVALPESVARGAGIFVKPSDFTGIVNTANGQVKTARVELRRVQIGGISVRDVDAVVLPDRALDTVLLGMTFLRALSSFSVENGELLLVR